MEFLGDLNSFGLRHMMCVNLVEINVWKNRKVFIEQDKYNFYKKF